MDLSSSINATASNPEPIIEEVKQAPAAEMGFDFGYSGTQPSTAPNLGLADGDDPFAPNIG